MSYTTSGYLGSPRESVSRCKTNSRSAVTAEVASSSLAVPAILFKHLQKWLHPGVGTKRHQKGTSGRRRDPRTLLIFESLSPPGAGLMLLDSSVAFVK